MARVKALIKIKADTILDCLIIIIIIIIITQKQIMVDILCESSTADCQALFSLKKYPQKIKMSSAANVIHALRFKNKNINNER